MNFKYLFLALSSWMLFTGMMLLLAASIMDALGVK